MIGSELEFFLFSDGYDDANADGYRGLTPHAAFLEDYHILQTTKDEYVIGPIRRVSPPGRPAGRVLQGRGRPRPARVQPHLHGRRRHGRPNTVYKNAAKEIAAIFGRAVTFMAKYDFDDTGSSCHIHSSLWNARRYREP